LSKITKTTRRACLPAGGLPWHSDSPPWGSAVSAQDRGAGAAPRTQGTTGFLKAILTPPAASVSLAPSCRVRRVRTTPLGFFIVTVAAPLPAVALASPEA